MDELGADVEVTTPSTTGQRARGPTDAVATATRIYLRGDPLDMSALAAELGIGRATLYRWVGNREDLLGAVLAEGTERIFRAAAETAHGEGTGLVLDCMRRFMATVVENPALRTLTEREPLVFIRLATMPGALETRASQLLAELLERESAAGRLPLTLAPSVLGEAIVRVCGSYVYAHLFGRSAPAMGNALPVVELLLTAAIAPATTPA